MIPYRCGCVNTLHHPTGALRRISTCAAHKARQRDPATLDEAYYRELGVFAPEATGLHTRQLTEALGEMPRARSRLPHAFEIGPGVSDYVGAIQIAGYRYVGIEPSRWAAKWMREHCGAEMIEEDFEELIPEFIPIRPALVLAAHCLEHMRDAPGALAKIAGLLMPGGEIWIVVPDDSDPLNPDHLWFFTADSLRRAVEMAGLTVLQVETRRYVKREQFLYLRAVKP